MRSLKRPFAFFNGKISPKLGTPCCKYGLENKPFTKEESERFMRIMGDLIAGFHLSEDGSCLKKFVFLQDYKHAGSLMKKVLDLDIMHTNNKPELEYTNGDLVTIRLKSHSLNGLSQVDVQLAALISDIDLDEFGGFDVDNTKGNYRREARMVKQKRQELHMQNVLEDMAQKHKPSQPNQTH